MERAYLYDKYNTFADWHLILEDNSTPPPEPNENLIKIEGRNGSYDAAEALTGDITYGDRTVTCVYWTDYGTFKDRKNLLNEIIATLHGRKVKIIEPDRPDRYYFGRCKVKAQEIHRAYLRIEITATCEPWSYKIEESVRIISVTRFEEIDVVLHNNGRQTVSPEIHVNGNITLDFEGTTTALTDGQYKVSNIRLKSGSTVITVSGNGSVMFVYREGDL